MGIQACIDCNDAAYECRQQIDNATAYLTSHSTTLNIGNGLVAATAAETTANVILHGLKLHHEEERQRFTELRGEARKLITEFWAKFKLFPITFENGKQATAQVVGISSTLHIKHVGENRLSNSAPAANGKRRRAYKIPDEEVRKLRAWAKNLGRTPDYNDFRMKAAHYNVSAELIRQIVLLKQRADVK